MRISERLTGLLQLLFVLLAHILGSGTKAVLHVPLGFLNQTLNLDNGEVMLSGQLNRCGLALEDIDHHRRLALARPPFDGCFVAHDALLSSAL